MMPYVGKHIIVIAVAAALAALCIGSMARADTVDDILTVERCVGEGIGASVESFGEVLIEEGVLEEGFLQVEITNRMCDEILEQSSGGTPVQKLIAAQSYAQEIELVEGAMRGAAEAANATDRRFALPPTETVSYAGPVEGAAQAQYGDGTIQGGEDTVKVQSDDETSPGGGGDVSLTSGTAVQASEAHAVAQEEGDGSIAERWEEKTNAAIVEGASPPEAEAGARCSLELDLLGVASKKLLPGMFSIEPAIPQKMQQGHTATVELSISGVPEDFYEELVQEYEEVAEVSEVEEGCVGLTKRMEATLIGQPFEITPNQGDDSSVRQVAQNTVWSWGITATTTGSHLLYLNLGQEIKQAGGNSSFHSVQPAPFNDIITVRATLRQRAVSFVGGNWEWLWTAILVPVAVYLWNKRKGQQEDDSEDAG